MTRFPRRTSRVKPPLRGRAATRHYQGEFAPLTSIRRPRRPSAGGNYGQQRPLPPYIETPVPPPVQKLPDPHQPTGLYVDLVQFYRSWGRFLRSLDQPWPWLLALGLVLSSLLLLNRLL